VIVASGIRSDDLARLVHTYVPTADRISDVGNEISYRLPLSASSQFPTLFSAMDQRMQQLGISNYAMSVTTLEEVFIK
jgi:ATP-binding cassette subfamily A (ABC1) protein 3